VWEEKLNLKLGLFLVSNCYCLVSLMKVYAGGKILKLKADHFKIGLLVIVLVSKLFGFSKLNFQA